MKCSLIKLSLVASAALAAGFARLDNPDDKVVTTEKEARNYRGFVIEEDGVSVSDLHVICREGFVVINFIDETGSRVNYSYPTHTVARVKHLHKPQVN